MEYTLKQIKKELKDAIRIEEALLEMLVNGNQYSEDDLKLLTSKLLEACGYITQLTKLIEQYTERKKGGFDE
ncbi:MAG: hypothetical protein CL429_04790 [Acidimicrobiaceae bacterium]|nr:hypothetical protein [Acidimicrobiaceae bacterium]|tara:strand:- start:166 stop:381 length:216 start_codon:yes stop_codon:yes gene_type:complete